MTRFLPETGQPRIPRVNRSESDHVTGQKTGLGEVMTRCYSSAGGVDPCSVDHSLGTDPPDPSRGRSLRSLICSILLATFAT
jgi:hypothetical protein